MGRGERWGSAQRTPANETHHGKRSAQAEAMKPPNRGKGAATAEAIETAAQCKRAVTAAEKKPRHKVMLSGGWEGGRRWGSAQRTPAKENLHGKRSAQAEAMTPPKHTHTPTHTYTNAHTETRTNTDTHTHDVGSVICVAYNCVIVVF